MLLSENQPVSYFGQFKSHPNARFCPQAALLHRQHNFPHSAALRELIAGFGEVTNARLYFPAFIHADNLAHISLVGFGVFHGPCAPKDAADIYGFQEGEVKRDFRNVTRRKSDNELTPIPFEGPHGGLSEFIPDRIINDITSCLLYTSPSPRDRQKSRMPSSA